MNALRVLSVASEVYPLIKTGGLADVAGALPGALAPLGIAVTTMLPGYPQVMDHLSGAKVVHRWQDLFGGPAALVSAEAAGLALLVLDVPHLYRRSGGPYQDSHGADWTDNAQRFAALAYAAAEVGGGLLGDDGPDIVHAHDWQAALAAVYLHFARSDQPRRQPATIVTIHNIAFQGQFPAGLREPLRLPPEAFTIDGVEYYGRIGFLKGGLALADHITTVSPTYGIEIQSSEMGMGLEGLLRHRSQVLSGILNGADTEVWNPATDRHLVAQYDAQRIDERQRNKAALRQRFRLADDAPGPLVAVVSRLSWQKGMDLLLAALPRLIEDGGQLALLGAGDASLQAEFTAAAARHLGHVGAVFGYDERLSHLMQGGADIILVPSRFEPCGLTQLYGLRYGAVPLVARVGGLADTIIDANDAALAAGVATGFQFTPVAVNTLEAALARAVHLYRDTATWRRIQERGMAMDVSWRRPAAQYADLYKTLAGR
jgi:starch synthase